MGVLRVFLSATVVALFQGLGGLPLWIFGNLGKAVSSYLTVSASGMMVGAGFLLIRSAIDESDPIISDILSQQFSFFKQTNNNIKSLSFIESILILFTNNDFQLLIIGFFFGWIIVYLFAKYISHQDQSTMSFGTLQGQSASQVLILLLTMTCHSLGEGASIGVAAGVPNTNINTLNNNNNNNKIFDDFNINNTNNLSWTVILTLAIHNIPEGLATSLYLVGRGMTKSQAILWSMFCDIPLPLTAVPAYLFVEQFKLLLNACLGFAAGAMLYISFIELIPECLQLLEIDRIEKNKKNDYFNKKCKDNYNVLLYNKFINERTILVIIFVLSVSFVFVIAD